MLSWKNKSAWFTYILVPMLATALITLAMVNCTVKEFLTSSGCSLLTNNVLMALQVVASIGWFIFSAALLRKVYAQINHKDLSFTESFAFGWWFVLQIIFLTILRQIPSWVGMLPQFVPVANQTLSSYSMSAIAILLFSFIWQMGLFYALAIMAEDLSSCWSAFKYSWKLMWQYLLLTTANIILAIAYFLCVFFAGMIVVGAFTWVLQKVGLAKLTIIIIDTAVFGVPIALFTLFFVFAMLVMPAVLYRKIQMVESDEINKLTPPFID